jgi:hypothetical protein
MSSRSDLSLPVEILEEISSSLSFPDLASLARVNGLFQYIAESSIYHTICIYDNETDFLCLRSIVQRLELARIVKRFTFMPRVWVSTPMYHLLGRAIELMCNLVELRFPEGSLFDPYHFTAPSFLVYRPLLESASMHLRLCDFSNVPETKLPDDWLSQHSKILELWVGPHLDANEKSTGALPSLERLIAGTPRTAAKLAPGSPLQHLRICFHEDLSERFERSLFPAVGKTSIPLRSFECVMERGWVPTNVSGFFKLVGRYLPSLEEFTVDLGSMRVHRERLEWDLYVRMIPLCLEHGYH